MKKDFNIISSQNMIMLDKGDATSSRPDSPVSQINPN